ncbi:pyruvate kinase [Microbacter margulisiae]|uniref:Pyruvate kinase n=1 Tax=Microbacter margulisiae TaxID=1350067 RepID=A0A7W5DP51_9PORP|nr:pyruvate kinase [Microbacter margulisiae]MBB3186158.1 pyruvate kinase [Microbacter margulisiae]
MFKKTKIVATISDQRCDEDFIRALFREGMNVVRINTAHSSPEGLNKIVTNVRKVSKYIPILIDTKGPEIRTTRCENGNIMLKTGQVIQIVGKPDQITTDSCIAVSYPNFVQEMQIGGGILIDDGEIELKVINKENDALICEAMNDGILGSRKSINVPGVKIKLPSLTERDRVNILYAIEHDLDFIAHSFVRNKQDIIDIQNILDEHDSQIKIIAKIENQDGVDNADEILEHAYGIMVARGDLGIEVPLEKIPSIQRALIRKCVVAKKPVIVATQMLNSMIENPRPTRAEVTDVANAIFSRADAIMLSGETANGKYPIEAVRTMAKIAEEAEKNKLPENDIPISYSKDETDVTAFLAHHAAESASDLGVKAIITDTYTGRTARFLAAYRSQSPVLSICYDKHPMRQLALSYGVIPIYQAYKEDRREYFFAALRLLLRSKWLKREDLVSYLSGSFGIGGGTTFLEINHVGNILAFDQTYILPNLR